MNVALRQTMTRAEFLAWEERQPVKHEFDGTRPVAMTGGTRAHARIQANLIAALNTRLAGKSCEAFGSELKVAAGASVRYPDAFIVCSPGLPTDTLVADPVIVFEILSASTAATDRIVKNAEYRQTPSIQRYVMLEQTRIAATMFARTGEAWVESAQGPGTTLHLPEAAIGLPLDALYEGLAFGGDP